MIDVSSDYRVLRASRLFAVAAIVWMAVILLQSLKSGTQSSAASAGISGWLYSLLQGMGISLKDADSVTFFVRKLAHFTEYFVLGLFLSLCVSCGAKQFLANTGTLCFLFLAAGVTDEMVQFFVPGRSSEVRDILIDFSGCLLAFLLVWLLNSRKARGGRRRFSR